MVPGESLVEVGIWQVKVLGNGTWNAFRHMKGFAQTRTLHMPHNDFVNLQWPVIIEPSMDVGLPSDIHRVMYICRLSYYY